MNKLFFFFIGSVLLQLLMSRIIDSEFWDTEVSGFDNKKVGRRKRTLIWLPFGFSQFGSRFCSISFFTLVCYKPLLINSNLIALFSLRKLSSFRFCLSSVLWCTKIYGGSIRNILKYEYGYGWIKSTKTSHMMQDYFALLILLGSIHILSMFGIKHQRTVNMVS